MKLNNFSHCGIVVRKVPDGILSSKIQEKKS